MIGKTISHYKILEKLGEGGMGVVYKARDTQLERDVALKFLPAHVSTTKENAARFLQEARAAAALNHANICTIYGVEELEAAGGGKQMFISMEFIDGETLREKVPLGGIHDVVAIAAQVAEALQEAHSKGIVHRDIKADNIMVNSKGQAKVMDFGLAKLKGSLKLTKTSSTVGTLGYMSPEQIGGGEVDTRSDIFSFGVLVFEMLTGKLPFRGEHEAAMVYSIMNEAPESITKFLPDAPAELVLLISKALEKDPAERYQAMPEMLVDLRRLKKSTTRLSGSYSVPSSAGVKSVPSSATSDAARPVPPGETSTRGKRSLLAIGIPLLVIMVAAAWMYLRQGEEPSFRAGELEMSRLTSSGDVGFATVSPDGRYMVYAKGEPGAYSLNIRQIAASGEVEVIPPTPITFFGGTFSNDGNYVYYTASLTESPARAVYRLPVLGGSPPKKIVENVSGAVTLSPDDSKMAFFRQFSSTGEEALFIADADGSHERKLSSRDGQKYFYVSGGTAPAWSPDGQRIACAAGAVVGKFSLGIVTVDTATGKETEFTTRRWGDMGRIAWIPDGSGIVVCAADGGTANQIWSVPSSGGEAQQVTNDLSAYGPSTLDVTGDGSAIISSQTNTTATLWTVPGGDAARAKEITRGASRMDGIAGLAWSGDGRIVFTALNGRHVDLLGIGPDGRNENQIAAAKDGYAFPAVDPKTGNIYFGSRDGDIPNIWMTGPDGSGLKQVTGDEDYNPSVSPDGKWLYFDSWKSGTQSVWKMATASGDSGTILREGASEPCVSPDGGSLACSLYDTVAQRWRPAVIDANTGKTVSVFDLPLSAGGRPRWSPDGKQLHNIDTRGGVSNIISIDPRTGKTEPVTTFTSGRINDFAWSPDGSTLVVSRGQTTTDIVMLKRRSAQ